MGRRGSVVGKMPNSNTSSTTSTTSVGSSGNSSSSSNSAGTSNGASINYNSGNGYNNRETAFTWKDGTTTYSNVTNWQDAAKEAGKEGVGLSSAVSYSTAGGADTTTSNGNIYSFKDPAKDSASGRNAYAEALGTEYAMSSAGNSYNNGQTLPNTYNSLNDFYNYYSGLSDEQKKNLKQNSTSTILNAIKEMENGYTPVDTYGMALGNGDVMSQAEYQTYLANLRESAPTGSAAYTGNYELPKYSGVTADEIKDMYSDIFGNQEQAARNYLSTIRNGYDNQIADTNDAYDQAAQQAYIQNLINTRNLPQVLRAQGISGGAAESSLLAQQLNYENTINSNETAREKAIRDLNQSYLTAEAESNNNLAQIQASLQQSMISAVMQAQQYENEYNQWVTEYRAARTDADRSYALQMAQQAQAKAEFAYEQAVDAQNRQDALTQQNIDNAYKAAQYGDFSLLKALGRDTANLEAQYALEQKQAQLDYDTDLYNLNSKKNSNAVSYGGIGGGTDGGTGNSNGTSGMSYENATVNSELSRFASPEAKANYLASRYKSGAIDFETLDYYAKKLGFDEEDLGKYM